MQVIVVRYVVDNCFFAIFIYIYSDLYWQYIKEPSDKIILAFEKNTIQKKKFVARSGFDISPYLKKKKTVSIDYTPEVHFSDSPTYLRKPTESKSKEAEALIQLSSALKLLKTVRDRKKRPGMLPPSIIRSSFTRGMKDSVDDSPSKASPFSIDEEILRKSSLIGDKPEKSTNLLKLIAAGDQEQYSNQSSLKAIEEATENPVKNAAPTKHGKSKFFDLLPQVDKRFNLVVPIGSKDKAQGSSGEQPASKLEGSMQTFKNPMMKMKVIRNLNMRKEMIAFRNHNRILRFCASISFYRLSVSMSILSIINTVFSDRNRVCEKSWVVVIVFVSSWFTVVYFIAELSAIVLPLYSDIH